jgi:kynureninase
MKIETDKSYATTLDAADPLAKFRSRFHLPPGCIYFDGNSLGVLAKEGENTLARILEEWKKRGIQAWNDGESPWLTMGQRLGAELAPLLGVAAEEVIVTGTTTVNLHALVSTFYGGGRTKILADNLTFPTDIYALRSQARLRGRDPAAAVILVDSDDGRFLDEQRIIAAMTDDIAVAVLPAVLYRSGQLLDMERLCAAARERGIVVGFDCSHSIGVVPHRLGRWGADFAVGCSYKYLNGGPGCPGFLYLSERHFDKEPGLAGWFGYRRDKQFDLLVDFEHERAASGWQVSSPGILGMAPLEGALRVIAEAGLEAIREKSIRMTSYFIELIDALLPEGRSGCRIGTPREPVRRGGHVAVEHADAPRIFETLAARGVIGDLRPPNVIRLAPSPLYNSFGEIWEVVNRLREIIDNAD